MRLHLFPRTVLGAWSAALLVVFGCLVAARAIVDSALGGPDNLLLGILGKASFLAAVAAALLAAWAILRARERSVTAFVAMLLGAAALVFELLVPH